MNPCCQNTDRELYRTPPGDYDYDSIHVTVNGGIGMNCRGQVIVAPIGVWFHALKQKFAGLPIKPCVELDPAKTAEMPTVEGAGSSPTTIDKGCSISRTPPTVPSANT